MKFEIVRGNEKVELVKELITQLDDLTYDNDEREIECIKSKIKVREELLKQLKL